MSASSSKGDRPGQSSSWGSGSSVRVVRDGTYAARVPYAAASKRPAGNANRVHGGIGPFLLFVCAMLSLYDAYVLLSGVQ